MTPTPSLPVTAEGVGHVTGSKTVPEPAQGTRCLGSHSNKSELWMFIQTNLFCYLNTPLKAGYTAVPSSCHTPIN